jgi:two-component system cell cycle sensor histidine kinase/response regulator CckA
MRIPRPSELSNPERLAALRATGLLDLASPPPFARSARLAARLVRTPMALVSLVDADREIIAGAFGLPERVASVREIMLSRSVAQYVVVAEIPLAVSDVRVDPVLRDHPGMAILQAGCYLGVPLKTDSGHVIGALAAMDTVPRMWSEDEVQALVDLVSELDHEIDLQALAYRQARTLASLRETEERLRLVQRATNDVIWEWDVATDRVIWSDDAYSVFRYPRTEPLGTLDWWAERVHPEERSRVVAGLKAVLSRGGETWRGEYRFLRGDGTFAHITDRAFMLRDRAGRPIRMIGAALDVTERTVLEEQLRQAQKMEAVGRLAGGIAHDFNNLLTVISANITFARAELHPRSPAARELEEIADASHRAAELTRRLLAFGRKQIMQPSPVDLNRKVEDLTDMLRRLIGEQVQIQTQLMSDPWLVFADPGQLDQVLMNLVVNARDAMPEGGTVRIVTSKAHVDDELARSHQGLVPGPYVSLAIQDTGVGIREEDLPRIFEPFFTTKDVGKGTGLGLAMVYGIVTQSGGRVSCDSAPGTGTTFTVLLPRYQEVAQVPKPPPTPISAGGNETILLVEDEGAVRAALRRILTRNGYQVLDAADGAEALRIWQAHRPGGTAEGEGPIDLVLTDAVMPVMGGRALIERLWADEPNTRIILMSGYTGDQVGAEGLLARQGSFALLQKPFAPDRLLAAVRGVLKGRVSGS